MHGMWSSMNAWKRMVPALSVEHRVVLVDQIGHGKSDPMKTPYRLNTHARDLACLMDHLNLEPSTLVGFSMGAQIAQETYFLRPHQVKGLVLIATPPPYRLRWKTGMEIVSFLERFGIGSLKKQTIRALTRRYRRNRNLGVIQKSLKELSNYSDEEFALILRSVWEEKNLDRERSIRVPTLVVVGEKDRIKNHSVHMKNAIPGSELLIIPGSDHAILLHQRALLAKRILAFQNDLE